MADGRMRFHRFGRTYQLEIKNAADLAKVLRLDEALWVASSVPVSSMMADPVFLSYLDTDGNGRILFSEFREHIEWTLLTLQETAGIEKARDSLHSRDIDESSRDGRRILLTMEKIRKKLGETESGRITLARVREIKAKEEGRPVSESGVVLSEAAEDEQLQSFIRDVISLEGGVLHPSGNPGITRGKVSDFLSRIRAYLEWKEEKGSAMEPLGEKTPEGLRLLRKVRGKVEQYFVLCHLKLMEVSFPRESSVRSAETTVMDIQDTASLESLLENAPLARPREDEILDFTDPVNPRYADALEAFRSTVLSPLISNGSSLDYGQWRDVQAAFSSYESWVDRNPAPELDGVPPEKLAAYLEGEYLERIRELSLLSQETALELENIRTVEKLILFQANILQFANNMVSFPQLYHPEQRALFERGTLILDGRCFSLAVGVDDRGEHRKMAESSRMFVMYVDVYDPDGKVLQEVAVPVTSGGAGNISTGKRGVFRGTDGVEHDARVVDIIVNPISIEEAITAPFRKIGGFISGKLEAMTQESEAKLGEVSGQAVTEVYGKDAQKNVQAPATSGVGGVLAGGALAVAAISSAFAYVVTTIVSLRWWQVLLGIAAAVLAVILPAIVLAVLKLRRRDISAILEGSGWAINLRMRLTRRQSHTFTYRPPYPAGSSGFRRRWVVLAVVTAMISVGVYFLLTLIQ